MKLWISSAFLVGVLVAAGLNPNLVRSQTSVPSRQPKQEVPAAIALDTAPTIRNVILVSLDTTRWDALSCYNAPEVNSPNIGAFARKSVVFENAYAPMPVTLPSHATMLTGKIPPAHGVLDNGRYSLSADHVTLAEVLKENGFNTAAFVSALVMASKFGLDQGFDTYDDDIAESFVIGERRGDETTTLALEWLAKHKNERNFLFLHLFDPHAPYKAPEPYSSAIKKIYHKYPDYIQDYIAEIAFTDHCFEMLINKLVDLGLYENSLICVTADHGESHGEHGENTHGFFIYTSTMRVPMIFKVPGITNPLRVADSVGIIDITPTILSLLGIEFQEKIQGRNLAGYINGKTSLDSGRNIFTMSLEPRKYGGDSLFGIIVSNFQYIHTTRPELYDLSRDVYEKNNLIDIEFQRGEKLRKNLENILDEGTSAKRNQKFPLDTDTRRRLESLGYVTTDKVGGGFDLDSKGIDPKDLYAYHNLNLEALSYLNPKNHARALVACEDMIRMRPDFYLGYEMMARVLTASGEQERAAPFVQKANALSPKGPN